MSKDTTSQNVVNSIIDHHPEKLTLNLQGDDVRKLEEILSYYAIVNIHAPHNDIGHFANMVLEKLKNGRNPSTSDPNG